MEEFGDRFEESPERDVAAVACRLIVNGANSPPPSSMANKIVAELIGDEHQCYLHGCDVGLVSRASDLSSPRSE